MQIDFSKKIEISQWSKEEEWQQDIANFLKEWYSDSDFIITKTSGSTGKPKEIKIAKKAMLQSAQMTGKFLSLKENDSALLCMPSKYIAGKMMLVRSMVWKLNLTCIKPSSHPLENLNQRFVFSAMTPMQVENSLDKLENIDKLIVGGTQIQYSLLQKLKVFQTEIYESFGMTETLSHIALKKVSGEKVSNYFETLPGIKIRKNESDCLCVDVPFLNEELSTNDLIQLKNKNQFEWLGRKDNVINSGGIKISPEEVEKKLKPLIAQEFIVSSVEDSVLGNKVVLVVEGEEIVRLKEKIQQIDSLSKYEKPKDIVYIEKFARTPTGKVIRKWK